PTPPQNSILANDQLLPSSAITEPDNQHRDQQRQVSQRCLDSELTGNDTAEAATLEWLTVKPVNVIKRVRRKTNQQHRRKERANSHRARHDQQHRRYDLRRYDDNRCGPRPALVIESRRAQQLTHVLDERVDDRELRNRSEQKQRRQSIATYTHDPFLHPCNPWLSCQANHFLRRVLHSIRNREVQTRLTNDALTFFNVRSLEPHDHWNLDT